MTNRQFKCEKCGNLYNYDRLGGFTNKICESCCSEMLFNKMSQEHIEEFVELSGRLYDRISFGMMHAEDTGKKIPYASTVGARITDPSIIKLLARAYHLIHPNENLSIPDEFYKK